MSVVNHFNGLNGKVVSRSEIEQMKVDAINEEQIHLSNRLQSFLDRHNDDEFRLMLENEACEVVPESILHCLEYITNEKQIIGLNGLAKAVSSDDIYNYITDLIINTIDKVGHLPWQKDWIGSGSDGAAKNYISKKEYTGANFILNFDIKIDEEGNGYLVPIKFIQPYYLTFNQIKDSNATLKKGSTARRVIYYTLIYDYKSEQLSFKTSDREKFSEFVAANRITKADLNLYLNTIPVIKYYNVFRADDCIGLKFPEIIATDEPNPIKEAQSIIDNYKNPPKYTFAGDRAYYAPGPDVLNMPKMKAFKSEAGYYSTFFHEMVHSTGNKKRLDRDFDNKTSKKDYAFEELIAELGAVFLCSNAGTLFHTRENSAKYLKHWNDRLITELENDNRFFLKASAQAQKAVNYILNVDPEKEKPTVKKEVAPKKIEQKKKSASTIKKIAVAAKNEVAEKQLKREKMKAEFVAAAKKNKPRKKKNLPGEQLQFVLEKPALNSPVPDTDPVQLVSAVNTIPTVVEEEKTIVIPKSKNPLIKSSSDLMNMNFESLEFSGQWQKFMQEPARNMKIAIWGAPKNGKTAGSLQFADYLTKFGNVLYNFADQGYNKSTQDLWKLTGLDKNPKAFSTDVRDLDSLDKLCATGDYQFVFIDMISTYIERTKIKPGEFDDRFVKKYPEISFILIFEVTKGGNFKGDQGWTHLVDAIVTVEDYLMTNRGRYGVGEFIVWDEGLKKFNPSKYSELKAANEPEKQPALELSFSITQA